MLILDVGGKQSQVLHEGQSSGDQGRRWQSNIITPSIDSDSKNLICKRHIAILVSLILKHVSDNTQVKEVVLQSGAILEADVVVAGIGKIRIATLEIIQE